MKAKAALTLLVCLLATLFAVSAANASPGGKPVNQESPQAVFWTWENSKSSMCLGVAGGNMANGTKVVQWPCNGNADQFWSQVPLGAGSFSEFRNSANPNKCLGVPRGSMNQGVQLVIWDCNGNLDQFWGGVLLGDGPCFAIVNLNSGLVVGVAGGSTAKGAAVVQWRWEDHPDQHWC